MRSSALQAEESGFDSPTGRQEFRIHSSMVELLVANERTSDRYRLDAPRTQSPIRLAAMPPRSGRGRRRFESVIGDQGF